MNRQATDGRKDLQIAYLIKDLYLEYMRTHRIQY